MSWGLTFDSHFSIRVLECCLSVRFLVLILVVEFIANIVVPLWITMENETLISCVVDALRGRALVRPMTLLARSSEGTHLFVGSSSCDRMIFALQLDTAVGKLWGIHLELVL